MATTRKTTAKRTTAPGGVDVTTALEAFKDALASAEEAADSLRRGVGTQRKELVSALEKRLKEARRDGAKLEKAVRDDLRKALEGVTGGRATTAGRPAAKTPAAKKPAARTTAAKKPAAKKSAARTTAAKKSAAKKPAAKKATARRTAARKTS